MTVDINQTREQRAREELRRDPPCLLCEQRESAHPGGQCLFSSQKFKCPSSLMLNVFFKWGTYTREKRGRPYSFIKD